eukprot:5443378-Alexandrium_andersonii.AAC.1
MERCSDGSKAAHVALRTLPSHADPCATSSLVPRVVTRGPERSGDDSAGLLDAQAGRRRAPRADMKQSHQSGSLVTVGGRAAGAV